MNRVYIISNYDYDPTDVIDSLENDYILCQQGDSSKVPIAFKKQNNYQTTKHTGHNISDYLGYIIENYNDLPDEVGFIKGNIFPRHIEKEVFLKRILEKAFIPLYSDENTYKRQFQGRIFKELAAQQVAPGIYLEIANNWYTSSRKKGRYYPTLESLFLKITNRELPKYITMVPGACMIVSKDKIQRWKKEFYEELYKAVSYDFFPVEAYHVERCMLYLFNYLKK